MALTSKAKAASTTKLSTAQLNKSTEIVKSAAVFDRVKHNFMRKNRQNSIDLVPKLDLKKAEKFANLPDPYAYLKDLEQAEEEKT